jgi:RNA polymerase sigma factor (sigma-70 family)
MSLVPKTSTTLLHDLANDSCSVRWTEFVENYRPMMEAYMRERFPSVDAEDAIQDTLVAIFKIIPHFDYSPQAKGAFHNYITGVLRRKALQIVEGSKRRLTREARYTSTHVEEPCSVSDEAYRKSIFEIALHQILTDPGINERTKQIFIRTAVNGEKPCDVAQAFGIARNAVDQIKARMTGRMREIVNTLETFGVETF